VKNKLKKLKLKGEKRMGKKKGKKYNKSYKDSLRQDQDKNYSDKDKGGVKGQGLLNLKDHDVKFFEPKEGLNEIDILPFIVGSDNHPKKEEGNAAYVLDVFSHRGIGITNNSFICLKNTYGKPCPICEERALMFEEGRKKEAKKLKPTRRVIYNVVDLNGETEDILLWETSHFLFEKELLEEAYASSDEIITFADLEDGKSIKFRGAEEEIEDNTFLKYKSFKFLDREPYEEDIIHETLPLDELLIVPTYEEVRNAFHDISDEDEEDEEERSTRNRRKRKATIDDHDDEDEDDGEEDESEDEDGEEDESEDEDGEEEEEEDESEDEKPARRKKGKANDKKSSRKKKGKSDDKKPARRKKGKSKCPAGHEFGVDTDDRKECKKCDDWEACIEEKENG
jgi:hypothetical protein